MEQTVRGSNSDRTGDFSLSKKGSDRFWGPSCFLFNGYRDFSPGIKQKGSEVDYSPTSSAGIKNKWISTSTPTACLQALVRDNFTLLCR
jgi:hypothetical protein